MAVTTAAPACLWVETCWHWPLISQDRQASVSPSFGKGAVAFRSLASSILLRETMFAASQHFLMDTFQLVLVTRLPLAVVFLVPVLVPVKGFCSVGLTCSN